MSDARCNMNPQGDHMSENARPFDPSDDMDMVPRRLIMSQAVWNELVALADAISTKRECIVTANDVATMAIEAGIKTVQEDVKPRKTAPLAKHRKPRHGK